MTLVRSNFWAEPGVGNEAAGESDSQGQNKVPGHSFRLIAEAENLMPTECEKAP